MNYYFILLLLFFLITVFWLIFEEKGKVKQNKKYCLIIFLLLLLFLLLRSDKVGIDNYNYKKIFEYCHRLNFIELFSYGRHEIGYKFYNRIISLIYYDFNFFMMVTSIVSMIGVYFFIRDNSKNYIYSFLIFMTFNFYGFFFGIFRQVIAISILLYGIKFIKERKIFPFLISVFLATLFHKTAFIFILAYPLYNIKINKTILIAWICMISLFLIFKNNIINIILNYIYKPADVIGQGGGGYKMLIMLFVLSCVCYYMQDKLLKQDKSNRLFINMIFLATIIQCLSTVFGNAYRVTLYFSFAMIIVIPNIIEVIKKREIKNILTILMIISLSVYYYYMTSNLINYVQYSFL